jgi:hypothetical protein
VPDARAPAFRVTLGGALLGLIAAAFALHPAFVTGAPSRWSQPGGDLVAYYVGLQYFLHAPWHLPLFDLPMMGYPEGGSVILNDAIPLGALLSKLAHSLTGWSIVHLGWWMLLVYVLQGVMAVRLLRALGLRRAWAVWLIASWAVLLYPFLARVGHSALTSHFIVLWAFALYFEAWRHRQWRAGEHTALTVVALLTQPYLFAMGLALQATTWVTLARHGHLRARDWRNLAVTAVGIAAILFVAGYGRVLAAPESMSSHGYGRYSWNPVTLVLPPDGYWGGLTQGVRRDATGGQYEGDSYMGFGPLAVLIACLLMAPRRIASAVRAHWLLLLVLLALALFALSNHAFFASRSLFALGLPSWLQPVASTWRASGRFIWPPLYMLLLAPAVLLLTDERVRLRRLATGLVLLATIVHGIEGVVTLRSVWTFTSAAPPTLIDAAHMGDWIRSHERLWQYPSWFCGGLGTARYGAGGANRELELQVLAARAGVPFNSIYMGRHLKDCLREQQWKRHPALERGVLYVIDASAARAADLAPLVRSGWCRDLVWGFACSRQPLP